MWSYSSLLGHILGSSKNIDDYFKMHRHYFSRKSILVAKLHYLKNHNPAASHRYFFDKLLHDHLEVSYSLLNSLGTKAILILRQPEPTILSIIKMAHSRGFESPVITAEGAINYYRSPLKVLIKIGKELKGNFLLLKSESVLQESDSTLALLHNDLQLNEPLSNSFNKFPNTSKAKFGHMSGNLQKGQISPSEKTEGAHAPKFPKVEEEYRQAITILQSMQI
jgi:hypothetical protein